MSVRSSTRSAVPRKPWTPGRARAAAQRRSSSRRSPIAMASSPTASDPRAGWSAAMTMSLVPGSGRVPRGRSASARATRSGSCSRTCRISSTLSNGPPLDRVGVGAVVEDLEHLLLGGHGGGALEPGRDDRAGGAGRGDRAPEGPPGEQAVAEGAAEGVAGAEAVDDLGRGGRDLDPLLAGLGEGAARALLDDGDLDTRLEERVRGAVGVGLPDGDLALLAVADGDRHAGQEPAHLVARLLPGGPEHRPVVEVEDGVLAAPARLEGGVVGGAG